MKKAELIYTELRYNGKIRGATMIDENREKK